MFSVLFLFCSFCLSFPSFFSSFLFLFLCSSSSSCYEYIICCFYSGPFDPSCFCCWHFCGCLFFTLLLNIFCIFLAMFICWFLCINCVSFFVLFLLVNLLFVLNGPQGLLVVLFSLLLYWFFSSFFCCWLFFFTFFCGYFWLFDLNAVVFHVVLVDPPPLIKIWIIRMFSLFLHCFLCSSGWGVLLHLVEKKVHQTTWLVNGAIYKFCFCLFPTDFFLFLGLIQTKQRLVINSTIFKFPLLFCSWWPKTSPSKKIPDSFLLTHTNWKKYK